MGSPALRSPRAPRGLPVPLSRRALAGSLGLPAANAAWCPPGTAFPCRRCAARADAGAARTPRRVFSGCHAHRFACDADAVHGRCRTSPGRAASACACGSPGERGFERRRGAASRWSRAVGSRAAEHPRTRNVAQAAARLIVSQGRRIFQVKDMSRDAPIPSACQDLVQRGHGTILRIACLPTHRHWRAGWFPHRTSRPGRP